MNDNVKKVFEMLNLKPDEEFTIVQFPKDKKNVFKIAEKFCVYDVTNGYINRDDILCSLINGTYTIEKIAKKEKKEQKQMTDNVKKVFEMLGVEPNEVFKIRKKDGYIKELFYKVDEHLDIYFFSDENRKESRSNFTLVDLLNGKYTIVKLSKKKKLRDLTLEEFDIWCDKHCDSYSDAECEKCPFNYVECGINDDRCWVEHKDLYSDKFLDQEIEVE